jgi:ABC-type sugar transport system substrate-binding protein
MVDHKWRMIFCVTILCFIILSMPSRGLADRIIKVGFATKSATNMFWPLLQAGGKDAAKDLNAVLITVGPSKVNDIEGQLDVVDELIDQKIDTLVVAPCDSTGIVPAVKKAQRRKIPVIAVDTAVIGVEITSFIATDNVTAVESAAAWIATQLKGSGRVVMINGMLNQQTGKDRRDGFVNYMKQHYPGVEVTREIPAEWDPLKAKRGMDEVLRENLQVDAVFCSWDDATLAALDSLEEEKRNNRILLIGFDGAPNALKLLKQGKVDADVAQFPYKMGYQAIKYAIYAAKGKKIPARILIDSMVVTRENLNEFLMKAHMTLGD